MANEYHMHMHKKGIMLNPQKTQSRTLSTHLRTTFLSLSPPFHSYFRHPLTSEVPFNRFPCKTVGSSSLVLVPLPASGI
jgi:hypothetical protein